MENVAFDTWVAVYGDDAEFIADARDGYEYPPIDVSRLPAMVATHPGVTSMAEYVATGNGSWGHLGNEIRKAVCSLCAWAVPSPGALAAVAGWAGTAGVVEVGAGTGYWAALLAGMGVDVVASDASLPSAGGNLWHPDGVMWWDLEAAPASAAFMQPARSMLVCWPPNEAGGAFGVDGYREAGGGQVIFVGEWQKGCVDDALWDELNGRWQVVDRAQVPQWTLMRDEMLLFQPR